MRAGGGRGWCIAGGGMLGLALASRLARAGERVTLKEAAGSVGGLAGAWQLGDVTWDRYYHVILRSDAALLALLRELGLAEEVRWTTTQTGFFIDGRLVRLNDALDYLRFPALGPIDKARLAATILYAARIEDGAALEQVPVADWLTRLSGRRTFERIWRPLLRAKLGPNHAHASAAFIWAVVRRLYAARRSGLKREQFGYVPGGYARILDRFAATLAAEGVRIETGCPVTRVGPAAGGVEVVSAAGREVFDEAVVTFAGPLAAHVCAGLLPAEAERLAGVLYQGVVCTTLLLRRPLSPYYLTYLADPGLPFTAVVDMSALVDPAQFAGRGLVYLPRYVATDDPALERDDADVAAEAVAALARVYPGFTPADVSCARVARTRHVLAVPTLDYSRRLPPMLTTVPGLHLLNSAHIVDGTLNVNETLRLVERAAPRLLAAARGRAPAPSPAMASA